MPETVVAVTAAAPAINWAQLQFLLNLSNFALTVIVALFAWWTRRDRETAERFTAVETRTSAHLAAVEQTLKTRIDAIDKDLRVRIDAVESAGVARGDGHRTRLDALLERVARVEERISALPTAAALASVEGDVHAVRESVEGVETQMRGMLGQLQLINQHLLARKE